MRLCTRLLTQVLNDLLDDRLFQDGRNDPEHAAAVRAVLHIEPKHAVDAGDVRVIN